MKYTQMGRNQETPSLLGFGCMRFPTVKENEKEGIDVREAEKMMEMAIKGGVNYFDTAYPYHGGQSEEVLGSFMKKRKRGEYYVATKLPMWEVKEREDVNRLLEGQLKKLQMDYVDYYMLHALNKSHWELTKKLGILEVLDEYKKKGNIRNIGFSFHDEYDVFEEILRARDWDFCQIQLNYIDVDLQAGLKGYHLATELGVPVIVMEPVKGGSLVQFADDVVTMLKDCQPGWSVASWAIRWVASLPNVRVILSGMSTREQVEDNLATIDDCTPLTKKEYETLEGAVKQIQSRVRNGCTGCGYCVPCPAGVDIPKCFYVWNQYEMYRNPNVIHWEYVHVMKQGQRADQCTGCGECEKACPQSISIRKDLKTIAAEFKEILA